jgi:hypothetical protein
VSDPTSENIRALADAVLGDEAVRLAMEVRDGSPHAVRRGIELAALVLSKALVTTSKTSEVTRSARGGELSGIPGELRG